MIKPAAEASRGRKTAKLAKPEPRAQDADLVFCCMDMLQIDRSRLMRDEPLLYRELRAYARCALTSRIARSILQVDSMAFDGMSGGCIAQIPQC